MSEMIQICCSVTHAIVRPRCGRRKRSGMSLCAGPMIVARVIFEAHGTPEGRHFSLEQTEVVRTLDACTRADALALGRTRCATSATRKRQHPGSRAARASVNGLCCGTDVHA